MNTKGQEYYTLWIIMEFALVFTLGYLVTNELSLLDEDVTYQRLHLATDLGLTLNALQASDANIIAQYNPPSLHKYTYGIDDGRVIVHHPQTPNVDSLFARDHALHFSSHPVIKNIPITGLYLSKTGTTLLLQDAGGNPLLRRCPPTKPTFNRLFLSSDDLTLDFVKGFRFGYGEGLRVDRRPLVGAREAHVTFNEGLSSTALTLLVNTNPESYALACAMGNSALEQIKELTALNIVPTNELSASGVAVVVSLSLEQQKNAHTLSAALAQGARNLLEASS